MKRINVLLSLAFVCLVSGSTVFAQAERALLQKQLEADKAAEAEAKAKAEAEAKAEDPLSIEVSKTGIINVIRDEEGEISEIKLVVLSYNIALDERTRLLAGLEGKKVKLTGEFQGEISDRESRLFKVKNIDPLEDGD